MSESNHQAIPDYAKVVLVPVANPATAPHMLHLGSIMAHPANGRVIALIVSLGDPESLAKSASQLEPIVAEFQEAGHPVELVTEVATSIARGILDVARDTMADLVILGIMKPTRGQAAMGTIAEGVIATAPCDVLVYRHATKTEFSRIIVPVDGTLVSRVAARTGILLANGYGKPIEAMYAQPGYYPEWQGLARIEQSLQEIPGGRICKRTVVKAADPASGVLSRLSEDDLVVIAAPRLSAFEKWLSGDFSQAILDHSPGAVILASRRTGEDGRVGAVRRRLRALTPTLTRVEQEEIVRQSQEMASPSLDYFVLIIIAALLASFGLLQSSPAVIIGAMLVAPLMQPLIAFATGLTTGRLELMRQAVVTGIQGILLALLIAVGVGIIAGTDLPTSEMLARGSPTLLDALVAVASGLVGAYATARKDIPAALAGVAIAAALMPPVCTVGLGIAMQNINLAAGSGLLFLTNITSIIIAGWIIFFWLGMRPRMVETSRRRQYISVAFLVILLLPVVILLLRLSNTSGNRNVIEQKVIAAFAPADVVGIQVTQGDTLHVVATVQSEHIITTQTVRDAQDTLTAELGEPVELEVIYLQVVKPAAP
ncbi:MAG: TIGR00341 family protein [Anaerolineaceae bacterium]|nr:TIGR00341 family protein [Anaerolineaceae bacterium]